ncbi:MAG: ribosome maturation factor RimM [Anaerolineae bacterium]|nr:ribosome maturation factor RimM [Anaerolineae bacterium]
MVAKRIAKPNYLLIGEVLRPHGIRGELRLKILTDYPERVSKIKTVYLGSDANQTDATPYSVQSARLNKQFLLLMLKEIQSRNDAETLRGQFVMIDTDNAIPLDDDEIYLYELIGLTVKTDTGQELGAIKDVIETGANDVYVVSSRQYGEVLIPVHDETLIEIDTDAAIVTVKLPNGLLPE